MRNLHGVARQQYRAMISALIRTIFAQLDFQATSAQLRAVADQLDSVAPAVSERLLAMEADLLAYTPVPAIAAASVADLTDQPGELALPAAPQT
jgi:putative transposase